MRIDLGERHSIGAKRCFKIAIICVGRLEHDQPRFVFLSSGQGSFGPLCEIRYLDAFVANCDLHKSFLCLVLSCERGARVSVQVEKQNEGLHSSAAHGDQDKTDASRAAAKHIQGAGQRLPHGAGT